MKCCSSSTIQQCYCQGARPLYSIFQTSFTFNQKSRNGKLVQMYLWLFVLGLVKRWLCWPNKTFYCFCLTLKNIHHSKHEALEYFPGCCFNAWRLGNIFLICHLVCFHAHAPEKAQNQIWCPLFSYASLNAMQNMEINQEMCNSVWKDCWRLVTPESVFLVCCR